ncbi:MAG TPA: VCBS repeat-containing protein [Dokdonella sp.]|uniref:FG-GAP repeat domain-containing protein n=1 Tax=Dokdonella sp. TaxID=2291710 RepID=UPI002D80D731|nr:VCBS repeat-containing protein [Dokdonella sp.]HET9034145.1 VCBS repeat-containing protein [Dokdonella sp.]
MPVADFDGDGNPDVVSIGKAENTDVVQILGYRAPQGWIVKQNIIPPEALSNFNFPNLFAWSEADGAHLLISKNANIFEYAGWPLRLKREVSPGGLSFISDVAAADLDGDGQAELIVSNTGFGRSLQVYNMQTRAMLWQVPDVTDYYLPLLIGQLDSDPALEIATGRGFVVDATTHSIKWQYMDGFGYTLLRGRFGGTTPRFAAAFNRLTMFQSDPWSPLWDTPLIASGFTVADMDGDGIDEIVAADQQGSNNGIRVFDVQSQSMRSSFNYPSSMSVGAADFDGDGRIEIATSVWPDSYSPGAINFRVIDGTSGAVEYARPAKAPGAYVVGGFVPNDPDSDVVFASTSGSTAPGAVARAGALSGQTTWETPYSISGQPFSSLSAIDLELAQVAGQSHPILIALREGSNRIFALSTLDGSVLWSLDDANTGGLPSYPPVLDSVPVDGNGDGYAESLLVCNYERLYQFRLDNQAPIWSSVAMSSPCVGVMTLATGTDLQYVAILEHALRAYDSQSHLLSWSLPTTFATQGASRLASGESGSELALFHHNTITFYDEQTHNQLREFSFPDEGEIAALIQPPEASIHELVVAFNSRLYVVDGVSGTIRNVSDFLGWNLGAGNHLAAKRIKEGSYLIVSGSDVGVFTHQLELLADLVFADGFEAIRSFLVPH